MNRTRPALVLFVLVALLSVASWFLPSEAPARRGARSADDEGRRALLELLASLGFDAHLREERPGALPAGRGLVWLERLPAPFGDEEPDLAVTPAPAPDEPGPTGSAADEALRDAPLREALLRGLSNPRHYRRFAEGGGTVLVEVEAPADLARLAEEYGFVEVDHLAMATPAGARPASGANTPVVWLDSEELALARLPAACFAGVDAVRGGRTLLQTAAGEPLALEAPVGRGSLVVTSCGVLFHNGELSRADHAVVAVRLAEHGLRGAPGAAVFLDESGGLGSDVPTLAEFAAAPRALPFTTAVALLAVLFLWRAFGAREIAREPPLDVFLSPRTRALARARLLQRARRFDLLARDLRRGTVRELGAALRIAPEAVQDALESADGARAFARAADPGADAARTAQWIEALVTAPARDGKDLARLDGELSRLCARASARSVYAAARAPRRGFHRAPASTPSLAP